MPLDAGAARFLKALAASTPPGESPMTVERRRSGLAELLRLSGAKAPVQRIEEIVLEGPHCGIPVRIYTPQGAPQGVLPGLIYLHGGGLVAGSMLTHEAIACALASGSACRLVSIEYRLAPEHRFPAGLEDALAAVRQLRLRAADFGIDPGRIGVCGDSAGGTLAAAACQALALAGAPPPALLVLLCPILDYSRQTPSRREFASGYLIDQATLDHDLLHFLPAGADPADPRISPLRAASLAGLPRTIVHTAEFDPVRDEGRAFAERLSQAGVAVSYTCHPGMIHLFYGLGAVIPTARGALDAIGAEIRGALTH